MSKKKYDGTSLYSLEVKVDLFTLRRINEDASRRGILVGEYAGQILKRIMRVRYPKKREKFDQGELF